MCCIKEQTKTLEVTTACKSKQRPRLTVNDLYLRFINNLSPLESMLRICKLSLISLEVRRDPYTEKFKYDTLPTKLVRVQVKNKTSTYRVQTLDAIEKEAVAVHIAASHVLVVQDCTGLDTISGDWKPHERWGENLLTLTVQYSAYSFWLFHAFWAVYKYIVCSTQTIFFLSLFRIQV